MLRSKIFTLFVFFTFALLTFFEGNASAACFPINLPVAGPPPMGFQFPGVALDGNSNALAVFTDGNTDTLFSSSISNPYTSWSATPSPITPVPPIALALFGSPPVVAIDSSGTKTAAWPMEDGVNFFFQAERQALNDSTWPSGSPITTPIIAPISDLFLPSLAGDSKGNVIAAWLDSPTSPVATFNATVLPAGASSWSTFEFLASDTNNALHFGPQTSVNNDHAIVVWAVYDTSPIQIQAERYSFATNTWSTVPALVLPSNVADVLQLSVAIDPNGNTIVAMIANIGTSFQTLVSVLPISTSIWTIPQDVSNPAQFVQTSPSVLSTSIDAQGNATVVWPEGAVSTGPYDLKATIVLLSGIPATAIVISSAPSNQITGIQVVSDSAGNAIAVWSTQEASGAFTVQEATKQFQQSWSPACQLSDTGTSPFVALNDQETAVIVWQDTNTFFIQSAIFPGIFPIIIPPQPPTNFIGRLIRNKFIDRRECSLLTKWDPSPSSNVVSYVIFKNGGIIGTVLENQPLFFDIKKVPCKNIKDIFTIKAVADNGLESSAVQLKIEK